MCSCCGVNDAKLLLICVYMPCNDSRANQNLLEYVHVNDIDVICNIYIVNVFLHACK